MNTEAKIVARALEMFNERSVEYVGLRELAATLGMRVSNITYYFPTKDDLVKRLVTDLAELNASIAAAHPETSLLSFLLRRKKLFQNQLQYRCLMLSFVQIMEQNKKIALQYAETEKDRRSGLLGDLIALMQNDYLGNLNDDQFDFLVSSLALVSRFWISEAAVSYRNLGPEAQMRHYLTLVARLLQPYATPKGEEDIRAFLSQL